jgi:hypothetical protein
MFITTIILRAKNRNHFVSAHIESKQPEFVPSPVPSEPQVLQPPQAVLEPEERRGNSEYRPKVFISYSHKDSVYAHRLADEMCRRGISAWIDDRIDYGALWPDVIEENISECDTFVLVMTPHAKSSTWVKNELSYAQSKNKLIFPLLLEGENWLQVASMEYVDVHNGILPPEKFFTELGNTPE